jgi:hypothetical protein
MLHFKLVSVEKPMPVLTTFDRGMEIAVQPDSKRGEPRRIAF